MRLNIDLMSMLSKAILSTGTLKSLKKVPLSMTLFKRQTSSAKSFILVQISLKSRRIGSEGSPLVIVKTKT